MLPPQAPPASIQHANQAARDTLDRLADIQQWLALQQGSLPDASTSTVDVMDAGLSAFWTAPVVDGPGTDAQPRRVAFRRRLAQAARDDAALRASDGTLGADALALVQSATAPPMSAAPPEHIASELLVAGKAYAGALVLQDVRHAQALLFTTQGGWEVFSSLDALYAGTAARLGQMLFTRDELPGISGDGVPDDAGLSTRPIAGDVFETLTTRLIGHQAERVRHALQRAAPANDSLPVDLVTEALDIHALLDIHGLIAHRNVTLLNLLTEMRLASVPSHVRQAWERAATAYDMAQVSDDWQRHARGITSPLSIASYASKALTTRLLELGVTADPANVRLRLERIPGSAISFLINGRDTQELTLLELAFINVDQALDSVTLAEPVDGLTPANVVRTIRELDLGKSYAHYLAEFKGPSADAVADRMMHADLLSARMRFEAADARLAYYNTTEPASFLAQAGHPTASERGYAWVQHVLDHPSPYARPTIGGIALKVEQLTYRGEAVSDVLLIRAVNPAAAPSIVVYAPGAQGGRVFREYPNQAALERDFLLDRAFEPYLAEHLPLSFSHVSSNGTRRFTLSYLAELGYKISPDTSCGFCTRLEEPFAYREVTTSFLEDVYFTHIDNAKLDNRHLTRRTAEADEDADRAFSRFVRVGDDLVFELLKGVVMSVPHAAQAAWRFEDAIRDRDYTEAFLATTAGYTAALNVIPLYSSVPRSFASLVVRSAGPRLGTETVSTAIRRSDTLFDGRFIARDITLPNGAAAQDGVYAVNGAKYIRQGDAMYKVRFDEVARGWRLTRDGAPHAAANGPLVERLASGEWHFRRAGLLGGMTDLFGEWMRTLPELVLEVRSLSYPQFAALRMRLRESLEPMTAARVYRAYALNRPTSSAAITPMQQQAWREALEHARSIPRDAEVPISLRAVPPRSPDGVRPQPFTLDTATDTALRHLRQSVVPQLADFTAVEFDLLANRLSNHLGPLAARRVFRTLGTTGVDRGPVPSLVERTVWRDAVRWVHSLRPVGSPPLPAFLD